MTLHKIVFITGTRADFGKLRPLIQVVHNSPDFSASIFATGMHLLRKHGHTYREVVKAGFDVWPCFNQSADFADMDFALAATVKGLARYCRENTPDLIVVHGDRIEALAGAIVGQLNGILVAHVEGGELSGTVDETLRHAVTKLAHLHYVANATAARRVRQLGETAVYEIGSPEVDVMLGPLPSLEEVRKRYSIPPGEYVLCLYHPVTTETPQADAVFRGVDAAGFRVVAIEPNNDTGSEAIRYELAAYTDRWCIYPSVRFRHFLTLLKHAHAIVGNSSSGVREAPVYGTPTINVGTRQNGRAQGPSIQHVTENVATVREAILDAHRHPPQYAFGAGDSAAKFLASLPDALRVPIQKTFRDSEREGMQWIT